MLTFEDIKKAADAGKPMHITCPFCKAQYFPGEIFMPGALLGHPSEVVRDDTGKIIFVDFHEENKLPTARETFVCEYCHQPFDVEAGYISYKAKESAPETNFKQEYVPLID